MPVREKDNSDSLLVVGPMIDMSKFNHYLPKATSTNGGFVYTGPNSQDPISYSPVDITVALLQSHVDGTKLTNLKNYFEATTVRPVEELIFLTVLDGKSIITKSISMWKYLRYPLDLKLPLDMALRSCAKLTFKE